MVHISEFTRGLCVREGKVGRAGKVERESGLLLSPPSPSFLSYPTKSVADGVREFVALDAAERDGGCCPRPRPGTGIAGVARNITVGPDDVKPGAPPGHGECLAGARSGGTISRTRVGRVIADAAVKDDGIGSAAGGLVPCRDDIAS